MKYFVDQIISLKHGLEALICSLPLNTKNQIKSKSCMQRNPWNSQNSLWNVISKGSIPMQKIKLFLAFILKA